MGLCSHALFAYLASDLSLALPTVPYADLYEPKARKSRWPGIGAREVAALSLLDSIFKKFEDEKSAGADNNALTKFLECNSQCESFTSIDTAGMTEIESICLGEFKRAFHSFWLKPGGDYILNIDEILGGLDVGPGASVGVNGDSFYEKLASSPLTGTRKSLYSLYKRESSKYPLWDETEKIRSDHFGGYTEVRGSRLSFVPKSREISRTICTEPLLNMLVQKGIGKVIEKALDTRFGINLESQPDKNRILARIGSFTQSLGTIDLSSASDSISLNLLREIMPPYILSWMLESRSPEVQLPDGSYLQLHMVSSMGNAFTFPLQTAIFASVVQGVYNALGLELQYPRGKTLGSFAVFGDDIIVYREAYSLVCSLLRRCGFSVNLDKSFNEGPFRESCGSDFWNGYNVRGIYCRTLKTKQDVYSLINRLNVWSANNGIFLPKTVRYLMEESRVEKLPVPPWEADTAGIKMPEWMLFGDKKRRDKWTGSIVYRRYMPRNKSLSLLSVESRPIQRKGLITNNPGILLSAVGGYLRDGKIHFRQNLVNYKKRLALAPCWDWYHPLYSSFTSTGWRRWKEVYVSANLELFAV